MTSNPYLEAFLGPYWLRPETALWRAVDCLALEGIEFQHPSLDLGCGDGLFSFIRAGGQVSIEYDMFLEAANLASFFDKVDVYNNVDENLKSQIVSKPPNYHFDVGFDHKAALLAKASRLGLYERTVEGDANQPLPFADGSFKTIFSNILYWLDNYRATLQEIRRLLVTGGQAVLMLPNSTLSDYLFYQRFYARTKDPRWAWLDLLDRGRSTDNIKMVKSRAEWEDEFARAGLKVVSHVYHLSRTLIEAWDIGLRPISPFLIEMASKLTPEDRASIKQKWIAGLLPMLEPLCTLNWVTDAESQPAFHRFVVAPAT
ncbi:MAG: class I SAM-dependent methyltransferase [Rhodospirillales bacterium]|nr:MAG: class I SAM-dependent methyltransferase [Rhodospirillales bacterium]